jgi:hypothetical protein
MSIVKADTLQDRNGNPLVSVANGVASGSFAPVGSRNRIINGDMRIDQRNAGAAVTTSSAFPVDRFSVFNSTDGAFSAQQDSSAPAGFVNSVKWTTTTADGTLTTDQNAAIFQRIEGTNISDLGWGGANAKTVTLSFWVRSSLTGTFGGSLKNSAANRSYPFTYTISVVDTWEQKSVTIAGDTSGTWLTTTGIGIQVFFGLGAGPDRSGTAGAWNSNNNNSATGAVSVIGTLNATFYITGIQLEAGSVATPFERRQFGQELALCQRYFLQMDLGATRAVAYGATSSSTNFNASFPIPVSLRATPTVAFESTAPNVVYGGSSYAVTAIGSVVSATNVVNANFTSSGMAGANSATLRTASGTGWFRFDSEL